MANYRRAGITGAVVGIASLWMVIGPVGALRLPAASLDPKSGVAGSEVVVTISQYSPDIPIEVRETNGSGTLIGMGATNAAGTGSFPITIPVSALPGNYLVYICGLCTSQYPEWATRSFQVTGPAPSTTTTLPPTTTTPVVTTTLAAATTSTAAIVATTGGATPTTGADAVAVVPAPGNGGSSRGLLIGAIAVLTAMLMAIVGILIGSRASTKGSEQPPPPPPPPT